MDKIESDAAGRWEIKIYTPDNRKEWDDFVRTSRNGTFLFERGYMDYHSDRFEDYSLMAYRGGVLSGLLPANLSDGVLQSHGGLTYGGWVLPKGKIDGGDELMLWQTWMEFCRLHTIREIDYKPMPFIYCVEPSEEDSYLLFRFGGETTEVNLSSCVDLRNIRGFNKMQRRHLKKGLSEGVKVWETDRVDIFMNMIAECLSERHDASPVHSIEEMIRLRTAFPDKIRFFVGGRDNRIEGGICIYETSTVAHCQYIGTTESGRQINVLSVIFDELINRVFCNKNYFDFGTSNESNGRILNSGLLRHKFSLGGGGVAYRRFRLRP